MAVISADIGILGGGVAGLSLAYFLEGQDVVVLEKAAEFGGLARSYSKNGIAYDVGPHIMFSKNPKILDLMNRLSVNEKHRRSSKIFYKGNYVTYPFENFLAQMGDAQDIAYCVRTFLNNPHENDPGQNMLDFFLKTFGEGITRLYLQPYNEKIWKYDPALMDTQMVDRIPKPPKEHILEGAEGHFSEGYLHQLYFYYPRSGGTQSLVNGFVSVLQDRGVRLFSNCEVQKFVRDGTGWQVNAADGQQYHFKRIVNCMPLHVFLPAFKRVDPEIAGLSKNLLYNSICVILINVKKDTLRDTLGVNFPQKDILFHRLTKLDFMGGDYHLEGSASLLAEVTYREGSAASELSDTQITERCIEDLVRLGLIPSADQVQFTDCHREKFAYVIYDLNHRKNVDRILTYLKDQGIYCNGRFAEFEYMNMDKVMEHSLALADKLLDSRKINQRLESSILHGQS